MSDILPVSTGTGFGADALGAFGGALIGLVMLGVETGATAMVLVMLLQLAFQLKFLMMESMPSRTLLTI